MKLQLFTYLVVFSSTMSANSKLTTMDIQAANRLAHMPLGCVEEEYPNKLNQVIGSNEDLKSPKDLHPAFYGCFDWHSSVHGHWSMVSLLKNFPDVAGNETMKAILKKNISKENIANEVEHFHGQHNKSWERTYGWAWLLKLAEELHSWNDPLARELETNLQPLTELISLRFVEFLPKLYYPIRVGEHTNTAFGMSFAYDYAVTLEDESLKSMIEQRAKDFYLTDKDCPITWEPSGFDFLSPCLQEVDIMRKILSKNQFDKWIQKFLPQLKKEKFSIAPGIVSDRTDGKLVHLDGVNFSRAWVLYALGNQYQDYKHLTSLADTHVSKSLPYVVGDSYEGGHWLGSFAIYALNSSTQTPKDNE